MSLLFDLSSFADVELAQAILLCEGDEDPVYFRVVAKALARRVVKQHAETQPGTHRALSAKRDGEKNGG